MSSQGPTGSAGEISATGSGEIHVYVTGALHVVALVNRLEQEEALQVVYYKRGAHAGLLSLSN